MMAATADRTIPRLYLDDRGLRGEGSFSPASLGDTVLPFGKGRDALAWIFTRAPLSHGRTILLPTYLCREVTDVVEAFSFEPIWYDVDSSLRPLGIDSVRATSLALFVNYFGFPASMGPFERLRAAGTLLVEDNAHGFLSRAADGRLLGSRGDFGITCARKTFSMEDGAFLSLSNGVIDAAGHSEGDSGGATDATPRRTGLRDAVRASVKPVVRSLARVHAPLAARLAGKLTSVPPSFEEPHEQPATTACPVPRAMPAWMETIDAHAEVRRRRQLYELVADLARVAGLEPVFPALDEGVVPYVFPFQTPPDPGPLASFAATLRRLGPVVTYWPDLPRIPGHEAPPHYRRTKVARLFW